MSTMPWLSSARERLGEGEVAEVEQHLGDEARVQQVQDRVGDAADVLVDGRPLLGLRHVERLGVVVRVQEPQEVPRAVDEGVHRVGVAARGGAVGQGHVDPVLGGAQRRGALRLQVETVRVGQCHRQRVFGDRDLAAVLRVQDRDGGAPVALARDEPVAQPVGLRGAARACALEQLDDATDGVLLAEAVERTGVDHPPVSRQRLAGDRGVHRDEVGGHLARGDHLGGDHRDGARDGRGDVDDDLHRQVELAGEVEVALVVGGHRHDGAVAVVGQHVVGRPHRDPLAVHRVDREPAERDAGLLAGGVLTLDLGRLLHLREVLGERGLHLGGRVGGERAGELRIRGHHHEGRAEQRVGSRREDGDLLVVPLDDEVDIRTDRAADPVALHGDDLRRPLALELVQVVQQPVGVVGDLEVPLGELLLHDQVVAALAAAVDDLLVGEHRLVEGAPVDPAGLAVGEALLVQLQEQPLVPLVVLGIRGVDHAIPVEAGRVAAHRRALLGDVVVGPLARVDAALDGGAFRGQAEGVPADRVQHVEALHAPVAGDDVAERVRLRVTHVQVARGVREHVEHVLAGALVGGVVGRERLELVPHGQPVILDATEVVSLGVVLVAVLVLRHSCPVSRKYNLSRVVNVPRRHFVSLPLGEATQSDASGVATRSGGRARRS